MEREIDLTPRHLVDWLKAEFMAGRASRLDVRASRTASPHSSGSMSPRPT